MFTRIAGRYDLMNSLMTAGRHHAWRQPWPRAPRSPPPGPGPRPRDRNRRPRAGHPGARSARRVIGADFAEAMLHAAAQKPAVRAMRLPLLGADALALPFATAAFAAVTSAFLLRNLEDLAAGLQEMRRVTKPGGRVVTLEITPPGHPGLVAALRSLLPHGGPRHRRARRTRPSGVHVPPGLGGPLPGSKGARDAHAQRGLSRRALRPPRSRHDRRPHRDGRKRRSGVRVSSAWLSFGGQCPCDCVTGRGRGLAGARRRGRRGVGGVARAGAPGGRVDRPPHRVRHVLARAMETCQRRTAPNTVGVQSPPGAPARAAPPTPRRPRRPRARQPPTPTRHTARGTLRADHDPRRPDAIPERERGCCRRCATCSTRRAGCRRRRSTRWRRICGCRRARCGAWRRTIPELRLTRPARSWCASARAWRARRSAGAISSRACESRLGVRAGETSADGGVTLEEMDCAFTCAVAPVIEVDHVRRGRVAAADLGAALDALPPPEAPPSDPLPAPVIRATESPAARFALLRREAERRRTGRRLAVGVGSCGLAVGAGRDVRRAPRRGGAAPAAVHRGGGRLQRPLLGGAGRRGPARRRAAPADEPRGRRGVEHAAERARRERAGPADGDRGRDARGAAPRAARAVRSSRIPTTSPTRSGTARTRRSPTRSMPAIPSGSSKRCARRASRDAAARSSRRP